MCLGTVTPEFSIRDSERETYSVNLIQASNEVKEMRRRELKATDFELGHLTKEQKNRALTILLEHSEVFSKSLKTLGHTVHIVPNVDLRHQSPITSLPYTIPQANAKSQIEELIDVGFVERSDSDYACPMILVKKVTPSGSPKYRLALDLMID
ncbi:hypothetical protein JTE90_009167 [Oedothorax gibbosus]|uniref:Uncharacterized protein n=1 Tax=Oedothorax gibbosus TaxID=931172 RepID=A0AAV6TQB8_9ARAC|nr:hypothetical protein JTE90_009167 [Oedothorax gibbosus]